MIRPTDRLDEYIDLWDAVDALPPKCKSVILMYSIGMTQVEMSEIFGVSQQAMCEILKNARVLLNGLYFRR